MFQRGATAPIVPTLKGAYGRGDIIERVAQKIIYGNNTAAGKA